MSKRNMPESWACAKLENLVNIISGNTPKKLPDIGDGDFLQFIKVADMNNSSDGRFIDNVALCFSRTTAQNLQLKQLPKNAIIFPKRGGAILTNKKRQLAKPAALDTNIMGIVPLEPICEYIWVWFKSINLGSLHTGSTIPQINNGDIEPIVVPLPPLGEQHRIVTKIESTFKRIEAIEKATETAEMLLTKYRESLLNKAFRGELVPQDPNDEPASKLLERIRAERDKQPDGKKRKKAELPPITEDEIPFEIPKSWEWVRLGVIIDSMDSGWSPSCDSGMAERDQWGVLKTTAIQSNWFDESANKALPQKLLPKKEKEVRAGDVLITRAGPMNRVGIACSVTRTRSKLMISDKIVRVRLPAFYEPELMSFFINWSGNRQSLERLMTGMADSQVNITQESFCNAIVPLIPHTQQKRILDILQKTYFQAQIFEKQCLEIRAITTHCRQSILKSAFVGSLVPQDPSEGTGHQLLEQILTAKANDPSTKATNSPAKKRGNSK